MKILITGGAGFIGRHLTNSLIKDGNSITIFDNFSKFNEKQRIPLLNNKAEIVRGDVRNYDNVNDIFKNEFDIVIHLAAKTGVVDSLNNPMITHDVNVTGFLNILNSCKQNNIKKIISASSGAVYGDVLCLPLSEKLHTNPISPYGASKSASEQYLQAFCNSYKLNGISLRFSNVYGDGQSKEYAGVITKFFESVKTNNDLIIYGNGNQTRDFIHVEDVVLGIKLAINKIDNKNGSKYNIATGTQTSINNLADIIIKVSNSKCKIIHEPGRIGEILDSYASIELAKQELEFEPRIKLEDGLKKLAIMK